MRKTLATTLCLAVLAFMSGSASMALADDIALDDATLLKHGGGKGKAKGHSDSQGKHKGFDKGKGHDDDRPDDKGKHKGFEKHEDKPGEEKGKHKGHEHDD